MSGPSSTSGRSKLPPLPSWSATPPHSGHLPRPCASSPPPIVRRRIHSPTLPPSLSRNASTRPTTVLPHHHQWRPPRHRLSAPLHLPLHRIKAPQSSLSSPHSPELLLSSTPPQHRRTEEAKPELRHLPDLLLRRVFPRSKPSVSSLYPPLSFGRCPVNFGVLEHPFGRHRRAPPPAPARATAGRLLWSLSHTDHLHRPIVYGRSRLNQGRAPLAGPRWTSGPRSTDWSTACVMLASAASQPESATWRHFSSSTAVSRLLQKSPAVPKITKMPFHLMKQPLVFMLSPLLFQKCFTHGPERPFCT
jgi:hypothetical protein